MFFRRKYKKIPFVPFWFDGYTRQEMVDRLNLENPISLRKNKDLVERVCARYPLLPKAEVANTIRQIFQALRDLLILGKIINSKPLFWHMRLLFYKFNMKKFGDKPFPSLRVKMTTPYKIKKSEELEREDDDKITI